MDDGLAGGAWQIDPETRASLRLDRVRTAIREGAWRDAILEVEELLDEEPNHPEALFLLGEALIEIADWELAKEVYDHRVAIDGGDVPSLVGLAIASFHLCDLPTAIETAREAARRDPGNAEAHHYLGLSLERQPKRHADALTELTAAAHLDPVRFPLPLVLRQGEWEGVISRALDQLPTKLQAFYGQMPFRIEELPDLAELRAHHPPISPTVAALYVGTPPTEGRTVQATSGLPDELGMNDTSRPEAIRLFARNLGRAGSVDAIVSELVFALREEALDWMGVEIDDLDAMSSG